MDIQIVSLSTTDQAELALVMEFLGYDIPEEAMETDVFEENDGPTRHDLGVQLRLLMEQKGLSLIHI